MKLITRARADGVSQNGFEAEMERVKERLKRQHEEKKIDELRLWLFGHPKFKPDVNFFESFVRFNLGD